MEKTIIGVYGTTNRGKSETIKKVCQTLLRDYPNAMASPTPIDYSGDILVVITISNLKIGLESQGDPKSRMLYDKTIQKLAEKEGCDIIVCATRTSGETVHEVDRVANDQGFHTLWISSFYSPHLNQSVLNQMAADNIIKIIRSLSIGQL